MLDLIRCPRCAKQIPTVSRFCRRCGCATLMSIPLPPPPPIPARVVPPVPSHLVRTPARRTARPTPARQSGGAVPWALVVFALFMGMNLLRSSRSVHTSPAQPVPAVRWNVTAPPPPVRVAPEPTPRQRPKPPAHVGPYSFEP